MYNKLNNIIGWLMFAVAFVVYMLTLEPSVSLWDCGEFISAADKLQVVHPPGAPFFLLLANFFSNFSFGNPEKVAWAVNMMSAAASAMTVMLTFWITTYFAKKIRTSLGEDNLLSITNKILIFGAGTIAALALTFSDTFWFSAVEAEVYALSSFFTALTFWALLKWESKTDTDPYADKWLVFIAYMIGLAIGTHLLNLLVIPTVAIVYYFKKYPYSRMGLLISIGVGAAALLLIQKLLIPGIPWLAANFDHIAVNSFGMPFYSGGIFLILLIIGALGYGLFYTAYKAKNYIYNLILSALTFIVLGYSSYTMVVVRSAADPAIDMNNPEDLYNLLSYINREQYGDRPLAYGPWFNSKPIDIEEIKDEYQMNKTTGEYEQVRVKRDYVYAEEDKTLFPRMGDANKEGGDLGYRLWSGMDKVQGQINYQEEALRSLSQNPNRPGAAEEYQKISQTLEELKAKKPSAAQNLKFLFSYQLGHMYWRYFFWNFAGRQNDNQSDINKPFAEGNAITGIPIIDGFIVGKENHLPQELKNHPARNTYFLLPFIFGVIGLVYQYKKSKGDFLAVLTLFFFTGIAIIIFLNQPPFEPRERDYSHVGSFQTFCIWIGLGVLGLASWLEKRLNASKAAALSFVAILLGAPILMGQQNWDDHDRSERYLGIDYAKNYLESCAPNAILFCNGDNDTYPLWYAQNVEGIRTDIRIINLALFPTDWYAGSLKRKVYDSEPFDLKISKEQLKSGAFDYLPYSQIPGIDQNKYYPLSNIVEIMLSNDENVKVETREGRRNAMPTRNFFIPIDKQAIIKAGIVDAKDSALIEDEITFVYPNSNGLNKGDLTLLDLISQNAKNGWKRPIYFTAISGAERTLGLNAYMQLEGLTYRFVPIKNNARGGRRLAGDIMYDNIMNKFKWSGMKEKKNFFVDEKASYVPHSMRQSMLELARMYADEYQMAQQDSTGIISEDAKEAKKKSIALMDKSFLEMPETALPFNRPDVKMNYGFTYIDLGEIEKGKKILEEVISYCERYNAYFKENAKTDKGYYESVQQYYGQILGQMEQYAAQKQLVDIEGKIKQAKQKIAG